MAAGPATLAFVLMAVPLATAGPVHGIFLCWDHTWCGPGPAGPAPPPGTACVVDAWLDAFVVNVDTEGGEDQWRLKAGTTLTGKPRDFGPFPADAGDPPKTFTAHQGHLGTRWFPRERFAGPAQLSINFLGQATEQDGVGDANDQGTSLGGGIPLSCPMQTGMSLLLTDGAIIDPFPVPHDFEVAFTFTVVVTPA